MNKINLFFQKIIWNVSEDGLLKTSRRMINVGWRKIFQEKVLVSYINCTMLPDDEFLLPDNIEVERYKKLEDLPAVFMDRLRSSIKRKFMKAEAVDYYLDSLLGLFREGGELWVAKYNQQFASYFWAFLGGYSLIAMLPLTSKDVDTIGSFTFPEYRGHKILPTLVRYASFKLREEGAQRLYGYSNIWNKSSIHSFANIGLEILGIGRQFRILGRTIVIWFNKEEWKF